MTTATLGTRHARGVTLTADRGYFAPTVAGETRRLTPEGFLICEDVAIARTGEQTYSAMDLPGLTPDESGKIVVVRSPDEVFSAETIASFEGKDVTVFHPGEFVNPENHRQLSVGHVQNVHRGEGADADLLKGDIVIKDAAAVHYAMTHLPDISCGYDAQYKQLAPGRAAQSKIRGNHAALVPNGRAGDRCAIKDSATTEISPMSKSTAPAGVPTAWLRTMTNYVDWKFKEVFGRGRRMRVGDDVLTGNLGPQKRIALGTVWTASAEELRDFVTDPVTPLQRGRTYALAEVVGPEDIEDYDEEGGPAINLGHAYPQGAKDALTRARAGRDQGAPREGLEREALIGTTFRPGTQQAEVEKYWKPSDGPLQKGAMPEASDAESPEVCPPAKTKLDGSQADEPTKSMDGRAMRAVRPYMAGTARGISTADYAEGLKRGREAMARGTQDQAPANPARPTAAEFARLHDKGAARRAAGG